jgi:hypothetical protein
MAHVFKLIVCFKYMTQIIGFHYRKAAKKVLCCLDLIVEAVSKESFKRKER